MSANTLRERLAKLAEDRGDSPTTVMEAARMALREALECCQNMGDRLLIEQELMFLSDVPDAPKAEEPGETPAQDLAAQVKALSERVDDVASWQDGILKRIGELEASESATRNCVQGEKPATAWEPPDYNRQIRVQSRIGYRWGRPDGGFWLATIAPAMRLWFPSGTPWEYV